MILGSEGRLGVITEAWVHVHRLPENREVIAYLFPNWAAGIAAMREIAESDATPSITRVSDAPETAFSLSTQKESTSLKSKDRKSTRLNSSHVAISYAVFCLKK